jgi:nicotinamide N-methyltransferase
MSSWNSRTWLPADDQKGYEVMILSDLLHFDTCHDLLVTSITTLLKRSPSSRAHVSAGVYTKPQVCDSFVEKAKKAGLDIEEIHTDLSEPWLGKLPVGGLDATDLALRKANCRYWVARWSAP